jgi:hypothetical protein
LAEAQQAAAAAKAEEERAKAEAAAAAKAAEERAKAEAAAAAKAAEERAKVEAAAATAALLAAGPQPQPVGATMLQELQAGYQLAAAQLRATKDVVMFCAAETTAAAVISLTVNSRLARVALPGALPVLTEVRSSLERVVERLAGLEATEAHQPGLAATEAHRQLLLPAAAAPATQPQVTPPAGAAHQPVQTVRAWDPPLDPQAAAQAGAGAAPGGHLLPHAPAAAAAAGAPLLGGLPPAAREAAVAALLSLFPASSQPAGAAAGRGPLGPSALQRR